MRSAPHEDPTFLALILEGDRRRAARYARQAFERHGVRFLYEEVVQRALEEVGELWQANRISIADEHLATATAQTAVSALYGLFPWPPSGPRALIACAQGERHEFGARMVADLLALDGWDERFFGADVPVGISFARYASLLRRWSASRMHLALTRSAIDGMRAAAPNVKILLGGRVMEYPNTAAPSLGADAIAHCASEAVEVARVWK